MVTDLVQDSSKNINHMLTFSQAKGEAVGLAYKSAWADVEARAVRILHGKGLNGALDHLLSEGTHDLTLTKRGRQAYLEKHITGQGFQDF
ncbi:MAG TPA: hypothetical protein DCP92_18735 [Nitrospiraceae bacterium]|jgi:hypothetical protein|nr:hypothetical protein [Nitrospiraceae bacterium]